MANGSGTHEQWRLHSSGPLASSPFHCIDPLVPWWASEGPARAGPLTPNRWLSSPARTCTLYILLSPPTGPTLSAVWFPLSV